MAGRDAGQVDIRFSVQNAETVRQALAMLGKDGEKALKQFDAAAKAVPKSTVLMSEAIAGAKSEAQHFANSLGPLGIALASIHPVGLVAAAAVGAIALVMSHARDEAMRLSDLAGRMVDFGQTVNLTVEQIQALQYAGSQAGVSNQKIEQSVSRLSVAMAQLRDATGDAYKKLREVDADLARQMVVAKDTAAAIDILAKAWDKADTVQKNALANALLGRRAGLEFGRILSQLGEAGGLENFRLAVKDNIFVTQEQAERIDALRDKIDATKTRTQNMLAALYTEDFLQRELRHAELMERAAKAAKEMADNPGWWQRFVTWMNSKPSAERAPSDIEGGASDDAAAAAAERLRRQMRRRATGPSMTADQELRERERRDRETLVPFKDIFGEMGGAGLTPPEAQRPESARAQLNRLKEYTSLLGNAITPSEQLKLKSLEMAAALEEVNKESKDHAVLSEAAERGIREVIAAQHQSVIAARARVGVASQEEMLLARMLDLRKQEAEGLFKTEQEKAAAIRQVTREVQDQFDAMRVRLSEFPQLTQLQIESSKLGKTLDKDLAGGLQSTIGSMTLFDKSGKKFSERLDDMARRFGDLIAQALIFKPLAGSIAGLLSGGLGGLGGLGLFGDGGVVTRNALGNILSNGRVRAFADGIVLRPTVFPMANGMGLMGEAGPEAIMPLRRTRGGRLGVEVAGGGSRNIVVHQHIHINGAVGSQEIEDRVLAGVLQANAAAAAMDFQRDQALPGRIAELQFTGV